MDKTVILQKTPAGRSRERTRKTIEIGRKNKCSSRTGW